MDITDIERLVKLFTQSNVSELEFEDEASKLKLVRAQPSQALQAASHPVEIQPVIVQTSGPVGSMGGAGSASGNAASTAGEVPSSWVKVKSPIVGTFYRKPSPDAEPFAKEGDRVKKGDTLCIIEAMKLMNEIEAEASGKIEKVLITDGQVVEYGEVLFLINPEA